MRYDGDYAFDLFLEQGGAASDQGVLRFLSGTLLSGKAGLQMGGAAFGCSTISVKNADGGYFFGRNFDWQACDALVVTSYPRDGYASISTVNLGFIRQGAGVAANMLTEEMMTAAALYAPLDGMNEKGLCVSVNMIQDRATIHQDTGKPDLTTTTAIRLMLDKAANVEEALALLRQYDLHASMDYLQENYRGIDVHTNSWSGLDGIVFVMHALIAGIYLITALFILVAVALAASKLLQSEAGKMAIYKSLGLSSGKLRLSFALRFLIVVLIGTLIGICLSAVFADSAIGGFFRMFGIGEFHSGFSALGTVLPLAVIPLLFFGFALIFPQRSNESASFN